MPSLLFKGLVHPQTWVSPARLNPVILGDLSSPSS